MLFCLVSGRFAFNIHSKIPLFDEREKNQNLQKLFCFYQTPFANLLECIFPVITKLSAEHETPSIANVLLYADVVHQYLH